MKKHLLALVTAIGVLIFVFVACGRNQGLDYDNIESVPMPEMSVLDDAPAYDNKYENGAYTGYENLEDLSFTIERISDEDINDIGEFSEFEYRPERTDNFGGDNVLIRVNQPISDFTLLGLDDDPDGENPIVVIEKFENIGEVTPDRPLLIRSFLWSGGALPRQGFSFITPTGEFQYHQWGVSPMDGTLNWMPFHWSPDYGLFELRYQY